MRRIALLSLICFYACMESKVFLHDKVEQNEGDIVLVPVSDSNPSFNPEQQHALIDGREANPADYPVSFFSQQGNSRCTAFLIGADVLSLAAHCVGNGRSASFPYAGKSYTSVCAHAPEYKDNVTADWALCKVSEVVAGAVAEVISQDAADCSVGATILLTGYGCTKPGGSDSPDGKYRIGEAKIKSCPVGTNYDIKTADGAAVCFGDSGGPSFKIFPDGSRKVLANTSRGDITEVSFLSSLSSPPAKAFYLDWSQKNGSKICGVHADATQCRGSSPIPNPLPAFCKVALDKFNLCLYGTPRLALSDVAGCREAFSTLFACEEIAERDE